MSDMNLHAELERLAEGRGSDDSYYSLREIAQGALDEIARLQAKGEPV